MTDRIEPTPEDLAIFERNTFRRLLAFAGQRLTLEKRQRITRVLVGMTNDYLEIPPHDGEIDF